MRFKTKHLREWGKPFLRLDSDTCSLWHIPNNVRQSPSSPLFNACKSCKTLHHDVQVLSKRATATADEKKACRSSVSSNYGLKFLSPASHKERISRNILSRKRLQSQLDAIAPLDCELSSEQHSEMLKLVRELNHHSNAVDDLCAEGDKALGSENNLLRAAWQQDVVDRLEYDKDQSKSGKHEYVYQKLIIIIT